MVLTTSGRRRGRPSGHCMVSAHRGCTEPGVGGTLDQYRRAAENGADFLEFDIRRTRDGELVVFHEPVTPSKMLISSMTLDELRFELPHEVFSMDALIDYVGTFVRYQIDLKEVGYEKELIDRAAMLLGVQGFVVTTLEDESIRVMKTHSPSVRVGLSLGRDLANVSWPRKLRVRWSELFPRQRVNACRPDFLSVHHRLAKLTLLRFCARHRLPAFVWTVNDASLLRRLVEDGRVECVITESPTLASELAGAG